MTLTPPNLYVSSVKAVHTLIDSRLMETSSDYTTCPLPLQQAPHAYLDCRISELPDGSCVRRAGPVLPWLDPADVKVGSRTGHRPRRWWEAGHLVPPGACSTSRLSPMTMWPSAPTPVLAPGAGRRRAALIAPLIRLHRRRSCLSTTVSRCEIRG